MDLAILDLSINMHCFKNLMPQSIFCALSHITLRRSYANELTRSRKAVKKDVRKTPS